MTNNGGVLLKYNHGRKNNLLARSGVCTALNHSKRAMWQQRHVKVQAYCFAQWA